MGLHVRNIVEHQSTDGDVLEIVEARRRGSGPAERLAQLIVVGVIGQRDVSEEAASLVLERAQGETGGFLTYIPLAYHPDHNELGEALGRTGTATSGFDDLKNIAIGRLVLDNIPHVKTHWPMVTPFISQVALTFGCDDLEGTVVFERVYHEAGAGTPMWLSYDQIVGLIRGAGKEPVERDSLYRTVRTFEDWVPAEPGVRPGVPGVRPEGPEGPTFEISHRPRARARGRRTLPVLSAVDGAE